MIENNQYAMGTAVSRASSTPDLYTRGGAFCIPGELVDGMDVGTVQRAAERAVTHCRSGNGPYVLELKTYRYRGHSMSDPAKYRTREEVRRVREQSDPIESCRQRVLEGGLADDDAIRRIDKEISRPRE